jgi:MFS family permease
MSTDDQRNEESPETLPAASDCPLSTRQQTRNLLIFGINKSLIYLAGCVLYVGNIDAVLLKKLDYSDKIANLPTTAFFWTTAPFMILFTWYFCQVRMLKPMLAGAYLVMAGTGALMVAALLQPTSSIVLAVLVVRAMMVSWCIGVVAFYEWEILARGVTEKRRGLALSLAYGVGPALAVLGSLGMQLLLDGKLGPISIAEIGYPWNYAILFGATLPIMSVAALLSTRYIVPPPRVEVARELLLSGVFGGIGKFFSYRLLVIIVIVYMLVSMGSNAILPSVTLNTEVALGESPENYVGYQYALRFGFKIAAGLLLGWLLVKTNAKIALLASMFLCVAGLGWAMAVSGQWYLLAFGILGAGELCCVYYQNYLISCSEKSMVRRNLAYAGLLMMPVAVMPVVYGAISDTFGFASSFWVALVLLIAAIVVAVMLLPARPRPQKPDTDT